MGCLAGAARQTPHFSGLSLFNCVNPIIVISNSIDPGNVCTIYPPDMGGKKHKRQPGGTGSSISLWTPLIEINPISSGSSPNKLATSWTVIECSMVRFCNRCMSGASWPKSSISTINELPIRY